MSEDSGSNTEYSQEFQQQIEAYIAWVNSQLKKRPGNKPVKDLRTDFRDGYVLVNLIEIISGEPLEGINRSAKDPQEKQHNISLVLQFLKSQNIRLHHISERDIAEGNVKSLMRLILTLAAHFKPSSVGMRKTVSASAAVDATVALGNLRRQVSGAERFRERWKSGSPTQSENRRFRREISGSSPISSKTISALQAGSPDQNRPSLASRVNDSLNMSPASCNLLLTPSPSKPIVKAGSPLINKSLNFSVDEDEALDESADDAWNGVLKEYYEDLDEELASARDLISTLQNLLLNGILPEQDQADKEENCEEMVASTLQEQQIVLQSKFDLCRHENDELKKELNKLRQEFRTTTASNSALRSRIQQQEKEMHTLKQQVKKVSLDNEKLSKEKTALGSQLEETRKSKQALQKDVADRNTTIKHLKKEGDHMASQLKKLGSESKDKLMCAQKLEAQVQELSHQLHILQKYSKTSRPTGDEITVINESLHSLRKNLPPHDSRQHIIDTLEQAIMSLNDQPKPRRKAEISMARTNDFPSPTHSPRSRKKEIAPKSTSTTVIYFTDRNMTPVRANIPKRIGDITLHDFKAILHHPGHYRYNFKALDPEFGTVKKEVFRDDDIVPGWEGKIVAWLEKEGSSNG